MVLYKTSRSSLIVALQPDTGGKYNVPHDALRPQAPRKWNLDQIQVNIQNTLIAVVMHAKTNPPSFAVHQQLELWDVSIPRPHPMWTRVSTISRHLLGGIPKPAFDPNGRFVCFAVGEVFLEMYSTSRLTAHQPPSGGLEMRAAVKTVTAPWKISVFALGPGLDMPERMATAEPFRGQPHLIQEHWQGGMKVDIVAECEKLDQDVLCYDQSGQYLFHMYVESRTSRWLSISRFTLVTGDRFQYARIRDFVMEIHNAIPIVSTEKEGCFLALEVTYQGFRNIVGNMFRRDVFKARQVLIAHLEERSAKQFNVQDGVHVSLASSEIVLYNSFDSTLGIWTPDMQSGPVTIADCPRIWTGRMGSRRGVAIAANFEEKKFALYSPRMGLIGIFPQFLSKTSKIPFPEPIGYRAAPAPR